MTADFTLPRAARRGPSITGTVVVGEDGSMGSRAALDWAVRQVRGHIHVVRALSPVLELAEAALQVDSAALLDRAQTELDAAVRDVRQSADVVTHLVEDSAPNALLDIARRFDAATIVMGSNGQDRFGHIVGTTVGRLIHISDVPIVVVPESLVQSDESGEPSDAPVVAGVTGDPELDRGVLHWIEALTDASGPLVLVHAISPRLLVWVESPEAVDRLGQRARTQLSRLSADPTTETRVVFDSPIPALVDASRSASLLVVGSHRSSRMSGFLTGSIAHHLPVLAHCPVAVVPVEDGPGRRS